MAALGATGLFAVQSLPTTASLPRTVDTDFVSRPQNAAVEFDVSPAGDGQVQIRTRNYIAFATAGGLTMHPRDARDTEPGEPVSLRWSAKASAPLLSRDAARFPSALPGIDVVYYDAGGHLEYDFVVQPRANPGAIRISVGGSAGIRLLDTGDLEIGTHNGAFVQHKPFAYQIADGQFQEVAARYRITLGGEIEFDLGAYNPALPLVIDPEITYATRFGNGTSQSGFHALAKAPDGTVIYFGHSGTNQGDPLLPGENFPRKILLSNSYLNAHLTRFSGDLGEVIKTVRLGFVNTNSQAPGLVAVGPDGGVVTVQGYTDSIQQGLPQPEPTTGPYGAIVPPPLTTGPLRSAIVKVDADFETLSYATLVRCTGHFIVQAIAIAPNSDLVLAGDTSCHDLPVSPGAYNQPFTGSNTQVFLMRLSADGKVLKYSTVFGGSETEMVAGVAIREDGAYVVAGTTMSQDFPTTVGSLRTNPRDGDGFVTILSPDGASLVSSTFVGGGAFDRLVKMALLPGGDIVVSLSSSSGDLAVTPGAFQATPLSGGAIARIASNLASYRFLTYAPGYLAQSDLAVDEAGNVWIVSAQPPYPPEVASIAPPLAERFSAMHSVLYKLRSDGGALLFSTPWFGYGPLSGFAAVRDSGADLFTRASASYEYPANAAPLSTAVSGREMHDAYLARVDITSPTRCELNITSPDVSIGDEGGAGAFTVLAPAGCPWMLFDSGNRPVLASPVVSGFGNGVVEYNLPPNKSSVNPLTYELRVNATPLFIRQETADCREWTMAPESLAFGAGGGIRTVSVVLPTECTFWHTPGASWLSTTLSATPFISYSSIGFSVSVPGNQFAARSTTLRIMGRDLPVTQAGGACTATVAPSQPSVPVDGGIVTLRIVTSAPECSWAASASPDEVRFLDPSSGAGSRDLRIQVAANGSNASRSIPIFAAGQAVTLEQAGGACQVQSATTWIDVEKVGGPYYGSISAEGPQCTPQLDSETEWIQPVPASSAGQGQFGFYALPNLTGQRRRATISVLGQSITVQQFAGPATKVYLGGSPGLPFTVDGEPRQINNTFLVDTGEPFTIEAPAPGVDAYERLVVFRRWYPDNPERSLTLTPSQEHLYLGVDFAYYEPFRVQYQGNPAVGGGTVVRTGGAAPFHSTATADYYETGQTIMLTASDGPNARFVRYDGLHPSFERTISLPTNFYRPLIAVFEAGTAPALVLSKPALSVIVTAEGNSTGDEVQISAASGASIPLAWPEVVCEAPLPEYSLAAYLHPEVTPGTLRVEAVSAKVGGLLPGNYRCTVTVRGSQQPLSVSAPVAIRIEPTGTRRIGAIVEGAAFRQIPVAPGSIASIFGTDLAAATATADEVPLPDVLGEIAVGFRSGERVYGSGMFYVSPNQINLLVPEDLPVGPATVEFYRGGAELERKEITVARGAPSLFTANSDGKGAPAGFAVRVNGTVQQRAELYRCLQGVGSCFPEIVDFGGENAVLFLELYGTGFRNLTTLPTVTIGGLPVEVEYCGPHGYFAGLDQINLKIPRSMQRIGLAELGMEVEGFSTNKVQVRF